MAQTPSEGAPRFFPENDPSSCRIETRGGTVYWLSAPESDGYRWVVREELRGAETETMVMQKLRHSKDAFDLGDKFRARLAGGVQEGLPFVLEVKGSDTKILTEIVVSLETGTLPEMVFG